MTLNHSSKFVLSLTLAFLFLAFDTHLAKAFHPGGEGFHPHMGNEFSPPPFPIPKIWQDPKIINVLKLTDEQIMKLKELDFSFRERRLKLNAQAQEQHLQLEKAFNSNVLDRSKIIDSAQKIADIRGKLFVEVIENKVALEGILTADQLKLLKTLPPPCHLIPNRNNEF